MKEKNPLPALNTAIPYLGKPTYDSRIDVPHFIETNKRVATYVDTEDLADDYQAHQGFTSFESAGPRRKLFFEPGRTRAAIVTCGGLCPGLNNVIQALVRTLYYLYGVEEIVGIPFGYEGLNPAKGHQLRKLHPDLVEDLNLKGGTILGSSRGKQEISVMVDTLVEHRIDILFTIGGDGTLRGAQEIYEEITRRNLPIAVAGIPKTIDNDINFVTRSFGFATAVEHATRAVHGAHAEAQGAYNGIGLVKVMGRDSGFIAAYTAIASTDVNYIFVPEVDFELEGPDGFLAHLEKRLEKKKHAMVLVAEGAGQKFVASSGTDASGNVKYGDIGIYMKDRITEYLKKREVPHTLKYIDPSYIIRSMPANVEDSVFCMMLAQNAVHGAMAGKTGFLVGRWNNYFTYIPFPLATEKRKKLDPGGYIWSMVKEATGMPDFHS